MAYRPKSLITWDAKFCMVDFTNYELSAQLDALHVQLFNGKEDSQRPGSHPFPLVKFFEGLQILDLVI